MSGDASEIPVAPLRRPSSSALISVIIPTLNEADRIGELIEETRKLGECEIIVADGGSADGTLAHAHSADRCLTTTTGRAVQQNAGAAASRGEVLLFLHADCRLSPGAFQAIATALQRPRVVGGCFRQRIAARGWGYRLLERGNALRVKCCQWAYGDQAIFVRRDIFEQVGRFPEIELMEDLFLMKKLKKRGRILLLDAPVDVSARRWQRHGVFRQSLRNWGMTILAHCGVSPRRLARCYPHVR